jgi:exopolysaccharide biosynthesis protein
MAQLGAREAINLDGGGSTSLVCEGRLVNRPREEHGEDIPGGRPVSTALLLLPRR